MEEEYYEFSEEEIRMNEDELLKFFNKYNYLDLFIMNKMFENIDYVDFETTNEQKVLNKVFNFKENDFVNKCYRNGISNTGIQNIVENYSIDKLFRKNKLLNEKELKFLYMMTDFASSFIDLAINYPEMNYNENDYSMLMGLDFLHTTLHNEIYNKVYKTKQKV